MKNGNMCMKEIELIFSLLDKLESSFTDVDNLNAIAEIKKYKSVILNKKIRTNNTKLEILDSKRVS